MDGLVVAFSGGVDSAFLLKVAHEVLGNRVIAVTARASIYPEKELQEAVEYARGLGVRHRIVEFDEAQIEGFAANPVDRCYLCKREVFKKVLETAKEYDLKYIADGSNMDDLQDYRPGSRALKELGVISPLREAGLTKSDIREFSKRLGLPGWDKPAMACLASRIPYGQLITKEKLRMVDRAEQFLRELGFKQVRVRHHGEIARIEVSTLDRNKFLDGELMDKVHDRLREEGFRYVALDLQGYRMGSLNEAVAENDRK